MAIIVAGSLTIQPNKRNEFIDRSNDYVSLARKNTQCDDFSVSPDPINVNRVNIFEKWQSQSALNSFRESDQDNDLLSLIEDFDVHQYTVT